ncbi:protein phosphatase Slingshot homolog 2-like [Corythoichthys intestinalis]|uniref:protein phosphatase Slingshot homolog 2-like n=1 Tax=Corythoichthys intestinalis TaxID=161448 RepID=UPI0025A52426|nr:protein phosphatase Slingshot homolog 2-like [Corythoichthys intestinalis]
MALVTVQRSPTPSNTSSPCVSESGSGEDDRRSQPRSISESFLTVKGAALFLPRGNGSSTSSSASRFSLRSKHAGDIQQHLQTMFTVLRPEDNIKLAVRLESAHAFLTRYMVVVSTNGRQDTEESVLLGVDFSPVDGSCSLGLVLPLWSDTLIHLDGDGGFSVSTDCRVHVFKPVSVQAMWSALQSLHKACEVARCHNYFPGSLFLTWVSYYQSRVSSDQARINEWNAMQDLQSHRADSPVLFSDTPTERELTEREIKSSLREIMMQKDLENVTCKEIRTELEMHMTCNLREFKEFIDNEMIIILGQMDSPTQIFDHVFLGSEWNASNLEELQNCGVHYILNVTREIDNFFPGVFEYHNIRVYDEEATDLLAYWNDTYKFITRAKKNGSKCLVHCKMGISRSAATVIAYAMKEYGWDLRKAFDYVKARRTVTKPNPSFMRQLEEYQGILLASKQRHNKLWRSHSDSDLSDHHEPLSKAYHRPRGPDCSATPLEYYIKKTAGFGAPSRPLSSPPCDNVQHHASRSPVDSLDTPGALLGHRDRIDFLSAREKFKGMAQRHSSTPPEFFTGDETKRKSLIPVQVAESKPAEQSDESEPSQLGDGGREVAKPAQEVKDGDVFCSGIKQEGEKEEEDNTRLYRDWTRGSVRRVTRQLERQMKRDRHTQHRTPSLTSSPSSHQGSPAGDRTRIATRSSDWPANASFLSSDWGGAILKETWETLRELGAFLQQVSVGVAGANGKRGGGVRRRVREAEARIRRAGLTPPSLMKRSASLAKLGCLELLVDDLADWELSQAVAAPPPAEPLVHTSGEDPKKQRVYDAGSPAERSPAESPRRLRDSPSPSPLQPLFTSRQQYGRSHPVRRLKKTNLSALYQTM